METNTNHDQSQTFKSVYITNSLYTKILSFSFVFIGFLTPVFGATNITTPINFGGGVDHANSCPDVRDNRACDAQNMIGDIFGSASKRNGSERYINQAVSTHPINSLYRASLDQGTTTKKVTFMTTWDRIYISTSDVNPVWLLIKGGLKTSDQHFTFANSNGRIVMTGDALTDEVYVYDIFRSSFYGLFDVPQSTDTRKLRAKYVIAPNGYLVLGNILDAKDENILLGQTTYYGSRVWYSLFQQISSFTASRFINIKTDDGESLTGLTQKGGSGGSQIIAYKPSNASSILYTVLNLQENGGDITVANVASGFGCISPRALVNAGPYDIVPTRDGIILYDGGRKARLNLIEEVKPISTLIKTDYERTLKSATYEKSVGVYYPKKRWYVFSFNDPIFSPSDRPNRTFIYDLQTGEWWPFKNWLAESFTTYDGKNDDGSLYYGDSSDGYVYKADVSIRSDDARKEKSLFTMDTKSGWNVETSSIDWITFTEGTASLRMDSNYANWHTSSMTNISFIEFGEWNDKSQVSRARDLLSFKMKISSLAVVSSFTIDLQYEQTTTSFTTVHSSITLSSAALVSLGMVPNDSHMTGWTEIKIALSSFPFPASWNDLILQEAPFSRCLTIYGLRFFNGTISSSSFNIDDIRVVQGTKNVIESYYLSKQFNLNTVSDKDFRQIILSRDKSADSSFSIDIFTDYGYFANKKDVLADIPKEIFVLGYMGTNGFARLKSTDFTFLSSTSSANNVYDYMNGSAEPKTMFMFDKVLNRFLALDRENPSVIISSYGSLGSGTSNFNTVNQIAKVGDEFFLTDTFNDRIMRLAYRNKKLLFVRSYGSLGLGTTSFYTPSGITADQTHAWVVDDGNFRIVKFSLSTFGYVSEQRIDSNAVGESVCKVDGDYLYVAYNKLAYTPFYQEVVLEKRTKGNMALLNRTVLRPRGSTDISTYSISGDFAMLGEYIFIGFNGGLQNTGNYYVQKLLKEDFSLVDETISPSIQFSIVGDEEAYKPITRSEKINLESKDAAYVQLRYYDSSEDNTFKLHNYSFGGDIKPYTESP